MLNNTSSRSDLPILGSASKQVHPQNISPPRPTSFVGSFLQKSGLDLAGAKGSDPSKRILTKWIQEKANQTFEENEKDAEQTLKPFKGLKWYKVFGDKKLSAISMLYHFYFELYKIALILSVLMFIFGGVQELGLHIAKTNYVEENGKPKETPLFVIVMIIYVINIIILKIISYFQEKYLVKNKQIYNLDWSEDKFSLFLQDLPKAATEEEIAKFFDGLLEQGKIENGNVRKVIFLNRCNDLHKLAEEKERLEAKLLDASKKEEKDKISKQILEVLEKIRGLQKHKKDDSRKTDKAIIIFSKVEARQYIRSIYSRGIYQTYFKKNPKPKFQNQSIKANYVSEPIDTFYHTMHTTAGERLCKKLLTDSVGWILLAVSFYGNLILSWRAECRAGLRTGSFCDNVGEEEDWEEYMGGIVIAVCGFVIEKTYEYLANKKPNLTMTEYNKQFIDQMNIMNFFNYVFLFIPFLIAQGKKGTKKQIQVTFLIYAGQQVLSKIYNLGIWRILKRSYYKKHPEKYEKLKYSQKKYLAEPNSFDFIGGLEHLVPLIFMMIGFNLVDPLLVLGVGIGTMIFFALFDRILIIYFTKPTEIKSSKFGLAFLRVLNWDLTVYLCTIVFWLLWYWVDRAPNFFKSAGRDAILSLFGVFMGLWLLTLPGLYRDLYGKVQKKFDQENKNATYDEMKNKFPTTFEQEYPFTKKYKVADEESGELVENKEDDPEIKVDGGRKSTEKGTSFILRDNTSEIISLAPRKQKGGVSEVNLNATKENEITEIQLNQSKEGWQ